MSLSASQAYMPTQNQRLVLNLVRTRGPISRADIVRLSGLTFPSVSRIVGELITRNLVAEKRQRRGGMGKPPTELELVPESAYALGLSLDQHCLSGVLVDLAGQVIARAARPVIDPSPETVLPLMLELADSLLGGQDVPQRLLLGMGVSLPVPLHVDKVTSAVSESLSDMDAWQNASLSAILSQHVGCPVILENNATASAVAERWYGVGRDIRDFVYIFAGQGFGGGVILNGQPHVGYRGFGGEICGMPAFHQRGGETRDLGHYAAPRQLFERLHEAGFGTSPSELEALYEQDNEIVLGWLEESAEALTPILVTTEYLLDPEAIIFGGLLPAKLTDALIERLGKRLPKFQHVSKVHHPQLLRGVTGEHAAALGAATLPIYQALTPDPAVLGYYAKAS